jgi:hypothetical protein
MGLGFEILDPKKTSLGSRIQWYRIKAPDPGSRIRIRTTGIQSVNVSCNCFEFVYGYLKYGWSRTRNSTVRPCLGGIGQYCLISEIRSKVLSIYKTLLGGTAFYPTCQCDTHS